MNAKPRYRTERAIEARTYAVKDTRGVLAEIARQYPPYLVQEELDDVPRIAFHIELIAKAKGFDAKVCDVGGGIGLFSVGCAALGMDATLVDDFRDSINERSGEQILDLHRSYGVRVVTCNVVEDRLDLPAERFDAVTSFHSMEHWHHSPKLLFKGLVQSLKPDGMFLLCGPNSVNLRKRFAVMFGASNWSSMSDWYEPERFRGHVREPDTDDLRYIARDLGLTNVTIFGRNWFGTVSRSALVRRLTPLADPLLNKFPSICSDIYMLGWRDASTRKTQVISGAKRAT